MLGQGEHVIQLTGGVHLGDRRARKGALSRGALLSYLPSHQNLIAPSGKVTPGKIRAPWAITLSAPTVTPSPSTAPPSMRVPSPTRHPAEMMQSRSVQLAPICAPLRITERSTVLPWPTRTFSPSTTRLPTWAPGATCT